MLRTLKEVEYLSQDIVAFEIADRFGEEFITINANGNPAVTRPVLKAFEALTGDTVVWEFSARLWRFRQDYDLPGRRQP